MLTRSGALDRDKQIAVVRQLTDVIAAAAADPTLAERTWVLLTEAPEGGWGLWGLPGGLETAHQALLVANVLVWLAAAVTD